MSYVPFDDVYPEHAKLNKVKGEAQYIGEFLEWLQSETDWRLCKFDEDEQVFLNYFSPSHIEDLLGQYFRIDPKKLSAEKDRMYQEIRADHVSEELAEQGKII